jgi:hypothetical protein
MRRTLNKRLVILLAALLTLAVIAAGCGGGDDGDTSATATNGAATTDGGGSADDGGPLTKEEFIEEANAICTEGRNQVLAEMSSYVKEHSGEGQSKPEVLAEAIKTLFIPTIQTQIDEIRELSAPAGDQDQIDALLAAMQRAVDVAEDDAESSVAEIGQEFKRSAKLARKYGLTGCAYG